MNVCENCGEHRIDLTVDNKKRLICQDCNFRKPVKELTCSNCNGRKINENSEREFECEDCGAIW